MSAGWLRREAQARRARTYRRRLVQPDDQKKIVISGPFSRFFSLNATYGQQSDGVTSHPGKSAAELEALDARRHEARHASLQFAFLDGWAVTFRNTSPFHHGRRHLQPPRALRQGVRPRRRRAPRRRQGVQARRLRRQGVRRRHGLHGACRAAFFRFPRRREDRRVASPRDPPPRRTRSLSRLASSDAEARAAFGSTPRASRPLRGAVSPTRRSTSDGSRTRETNVLSKFFRRSV